MIDRPAQDLCDDLAAVASIGTRRTLRVIDVAYLRHPSKNRSTRPHASRRMCARSK